MWFTDATFPYAHYAMRMDTFLANKAMGSPESKAKAPRAWRHRQ